MHLELMRYSCNLCQYKSYSKKDVRDHQNHKFCNKEAKKILRIGCSLCEQNIRHKNHFNNPSKPRGKIKCKELGCGFSTVSKRTLRIHHESFHLQITKYACNLCEYKTYYKSRVEYHQKSNIHSNSDVMKILRIGCTLCDQNVVHEEHTNSKNVTNQTKEDRFVCSQEGCNFSCNSKWYLR